MIPGEIIVASDATPLLANTALRFDRAAARGFRLNIPAGTAVRFEAGDLKSVELVALAGTREVWGLNALINGKL